MELDIVGIEEVSPHLTIYLLKYKYVTSTSSSSNNNSNKQSINVVIRFST